MTRQKLTEHYLLVAAISDITSATKENVALQNIALFIYKHKTRRVIPDKVLKTYIMTNFDTNKDGEISKEEAEAVKAIELTGSMLVLCVVTIVLTAVEFFYEPVLKLPFVKSLIAPSKYAQLIDNMNTDNYKSYVSLTFYNPNYFGGFCLLLLPYAFKKLLVSEKQIGRASCRERV